MNELPPPSTRRLDIFATQILPGDMIMYLGRTYLIVSSQRRFRTIDMDIAVVTSNGTVSSWFPLGGCRYTVYRLGPM